MLKIYSIKFNIILWRDRKFIFTYFCKNFLHLLVCICALTIIYKWPFCFWDLKVIKLLFESFFILKTNFLYMSTFKVSLIGFPSITLELKKIAEIRFILSLSIYITSKFFSQTHSFVLYFLTLDRSLIFEGVMYFIYNKLLNFCN